MARFNLQSRRKNVYNHYNSCGSCSIFVCSDKTIKQIKFLMNRIISKFLLRIYLFTGIAFVVHLFALSQLELPLFEDKIVLAYLVNTTLAVFVFVILYVFKNKFKNQLGFIFLGGSMIKFALFFLLFNTSYKLDGEISNTEFFAFFTPYVLTLIIEIFSLSKWLNKME